MGLYNKNLNEAGIYKLTCTNNGKIYIGKSVNIHKRLIAHKSCSKKSKGICFLQNVLIKHGWDSFSVEILEVFENFDKLVDNNKLLTREAYYIELFDSTNKDKGYNICKFSIERKGITRTPHSEETKEKLRQSHLGKKLSEEHKEKLRQSHLGKSLSSETKEKIRLGNLGRLVSDDTKIKNAQASKGRTHSIETKEKIGRSSKGRKHSDESKEKMSKANLGKIVSEETKEKMRQAKRKKLYAFKAE